MSNENAVPSTDPTAPSKGPLVSNKQYDTIKQLVQKGLPAVGALYAGFAILWGFPHGEEVVGSIALLTTFLGVFLGIADRRYETSGAKYDGVLAVDTSDPVTDRYSFEPSVPFEDMKELSHVTLKVQKTG